MRLVLHAGTHKTGTTTIQRVLDERRQWLHRHGVVYPDAGMEYGGTHPAHHPFVHEVAEAEGQATDRVRRFVESLVQATSGQRMALLSAEPVYRHALDGAGASWWDDHEAYLRALDAVLGPFEVVPLLVFRRRDAFLESNYHERVAQGFTGSFRGLLTRSDRLLDYERQLATFRRVFPDVWTARYERLAAQGLVSGFLELIGVPAPPDADQPRERPSPDARVTLWMAQRNQEDDREGSVAERRRFSKHPGTRELFDDFGEVTLWPDLETRRALLASFGDTEPISDTRRPASLDPATASMLDEAFDAYLDDKGLGSLSTASDQPR